MNLNIFSPIKRVKKRGKAKDEFDKIIDIIEKFAPKEHLSEREAFYYNYRIMERYKRPLFGASRNSISYQPPQERPGSTCPQAISEAEVIL